MLLFLELVQEPADFHAMPACFKPPSTREESSADLHKLLREHFADIGCGFRLPRSIAYRSHFLFWGKIKDREPTILERQEKEKRRSREARISAAERAQAQSLVLQVYDAEQARRCSEGITFFQN